MPVKRVPLVGTTTTRDGISSKDQRFINCYPEAFDKEHLFVTKRAGLAQTYAKTAGEGRGITTFNSHLYFVIDDTIYKDGSALGTTLSSSSGRCYFARRGGGTPLLLINDKSDLYTLNTSDTLTTVSDIDYPGTTVAGLEHLDQYVFVMDSDGSVYNSNVNAPTTWSASDYITAETIADTGVRITRHVNYIVAFGSESIEFFYDAANASGSPLSLMEGTVLLTGCSSGDTVVNMGQEILFVAKDQGGGNYVAKLSGFTVTPISIKPVDDALIAAGSNISGTYAYPIRIKGHNFYVLTIPASGVAQTWVYDLVDKAWHQWTSYDGSTESYFTGIDATYHNGVVYILDEDNGKVYSMNSTTYEDDSQIIKMRGVTERIDFASVKNKFANRLTVIGDRDTVSNGIMQIRWSDDDYVSFSNWRDLDLTSPNPHITRIGKFKRRAFEYKYEHPSPMRMEAFELLLREGHDAS